MSADPKILLRDIWPIAKPTDYKAHFAKREPGGTRPLDAWVRDRQEWVGWQEYRPERDDFNREFILSLMEFYHENDMWLFGGVFRVLARHKDGYEVELTKQGEAFIGRLKLRGLCGERTVRRKFENHYGSGAKYPLEVAEILRSPYSGREFPGYENIHLPFHELEALVRKDTQNWKAPLESVKGVYLITDTRTGRHYVGSAYGDQGVWSRWSDYVHSGHGNNTEFRKLAKDPLKYARQNFQFTLLEHHFERTSHDVIQEREAFWKNTLLTREKGLNRN